MAIDRRKRSKHDGSMLNVAAVCATDADALEGLAVDLEAHKRDLGAPVIADKQDLSTQELRDLAKEQEIPGRSSMDQDELSATVSPG
jgi:hypothetical protein